MSSSSKLITFENEIIDLDDESESVIPKVIMLHSSDGGAFVLNERAALESQTLRFIIEDADGNLRKIEEDTATGSQIINYTIPLPITSVILAKVIEFCKKRVEARTSRDLKSYDADFVEYNKHKQTLFALIVAADFLQINSLLDFTCEIAANRIKGMSPDEVRAFFNYPKLTDEEKAEVEKENACVFEDYESESVIPLHVIPKVIMLHSSDGGAFVLNERAALESQTLRFYIENADGNLRTIEEDTATGSLIINYTIPLPIPSVILAKVVEFCKKRVEARTTRDLKSYDADFVEYNKHKQTLFELIVAAGFLQINSLLDFTCEIAANRIKGMSPDEVCAFFNYPKLTDEEKAKIGKENAWIFDSSDNGMDGIIKKKND